MNGLCVKYKGQGNVGQHEKSGSPPSRRQGQVWRSGGLAVKGCAEPDIRLNMRNLLRFSRKITMFSDSSFFVPFLLLNVRGTFFFPFFQEKDIEKLGVKRFFGLVHK